MYTENYKTLMKEIKENTNRCRDIPCSWIRRINILKIIILSMAIYRFNAISIKPLMVFLTNLEQIISQLVWKQKRPWIPKTILRKKDGTVGNNIPTFRVYYKTTAIKKIWYWHKNRNIDQWNNIESLKINSLISGHFDINGGKKKKKKNVCSTSSAVKTDQLYVKNETRTLPNTIQFSSVPQLCLILSDPSTLGLPIDHQLQEFTQTHVHWVSDAI